jgi:GLPGLI family protein
MVIKTSRKSKILFFIGFLIFSFSTVYGQQNINSLIVEYTYSNRYFSNLEKLIANEREAVYIRPSAEAFDKKRKITKDGDNFIAPIEGVKTSSVSYFMNLKNYHVDEYTVNLNSERYIVRDTSINIEWTIDKKVTKKIQNYKCYKAITNFRGRNYVAFFSEDIPIPFGPFKFKGLPGLILEMYNLEDDITHRWTVTRINSDQNVKIPNISEFEESSMNAYQMYLMNEKIQNIQNERSNSRLPKGTTLAKTTRVNLSIEKTFEWETDDEEKK